MLGKKTKITVLIFLGLITFVTYTILFESNLPELYQKQYEERTKTSEIDTEKCVDVLKNSYKYYPETVEKCKSIMQQKQKSDSINSLK